MESVSSGSLSVQRDASSNYFLLLTFGLVTGNRELTQNTLRGTFSPGFKQYIPWLSHQLSRE